ncbi:Troponin C, isoform 3 [Gryllus bimaculatus]|nr:Troponin C, isoform 3 [Gryllus bimaculatus]
MNQTSQQSTPPPIIKTAAKPSPEDDDQKMQTSGRVNFDGFCRIAAHFLEEDDSEAMQEELKEAFRLYDREGYVNRLLL